MGRVKTPHKKATPETTGAGQKRQELPAGARLPRTPQKVMAMTQKSLLPLIIGFDLQAAYDTGVRKSAAGFSYADKSSWKETADARHALTAIMLR